MDCHIMSEIQIRSLRRFQQSLCAAEKPGETRGETRRGVGDLGTYPLASEVSARRRSNRVFLHCPRSPRNQIPIALTDSGGCEGEMVRRYIR